MEKDKNFSLEKEAKKIDATVVLVLLTVAIAMLDFYSHPNGGLADLERRKMLQEALGPFVRHMGNFGFSAAGGIVAVFGKEIANTLSRNNEKIKKISKKTFMTVIASILTLNALFETFPHNKEGFNDFLVGGLGVVMAIAATELAIKKFKDAR